jgi:hypothetical protein
MLLDWDSVTGGGVVSLAITPAWDCNSKIPPMTKLQNFVFRIFPSPPSYAKQLRENP